MMSYCHLLSGIGINFNLGFGPLPGMLIRSKVNTATCLTPCLTCASDLTITNTFSTPLTESSTWIKSAGQTNILNTASVTLDADPANGYILLALVDSNDFFEASPNSSTFFVAQAYDGCGALQPYRQLNDYTLSSTVDSSAILLFPIPADNIITLKCKTAIEETIGYEIFTIDGKLICKQEKIILSPTAEISVATWVPGLYFIKLYRADNVEMLKFQKK
jgi:hypothetical protein